MPQKFWKYKNEVVFYIQILVLIFVVIMTTLISSNWDYRKIKFITFGMMTFLSLYSKVIATNYASNIELLPKPVIKDGKTIESNEVVRLENSILDINHNLLEKNQTGVFKDALTYLRYLYRIKNEILIMDVKSSKSIKYKNNPDNIAKRKILHELQRLLEQRKYAEFDLMLQDEEVTQHVNIKKMSWKSMRRSNIKMTTLFACKTRTVEDDLDFNEGKVLFNKWSYSFKTQFIFLIGMPIMSLLFSGFYVEEYISSKQIWIDLAGYSFSIITGLANGFSIGAEAIKKGYLGKLQERIAVIQEVLNVIKYIPVKNEISD